jgi:hypothetical protein
MQTTQEGVFGATVPGRLHRFRSWHSWLSNGRGQAWFVPERIRQINRGIWRWHFVCMEKCRKISRTRDYAQ